MGLEIEDKLIECISFSSQQFLWSNAIFFAERLVAERNRVGVSEIQLEQSYFILASLYHSQGKFEQSFRILQTHANKPSGLLTPESRYLYALTAYKLDKISLAQSVLYPNDDIDKVPNGAAGFYLLGLIFKKTLQKQRASQFFKKSIELNPFMWCSFESLCSLGEEVDVSSLYGSEMDVTQDQLMVDATPSVTNTTITPGVTMTVPRFSLGTPFQATPQTPNSPMMHHYESAPSPMLFSTPGNPKTGGRKKDDAKRKVLFQSPETGSKPSRLSFTDKSVDTSKKVSTKSSTSVAKRRSSSTGTISKIKENPITPTTIPWTPVTFHDEETAEHLGHQALLRLIRIFATGYKALAAYQCEECIQAFEKLPNNHFNTAWVLSQLGRAHYETANYQESKNMFEQARQLEPYKVEGMEIYSTVLWHMRSEVELSYLAHEMTEIDRLSPQAWCVLGNCFSLQKEHDTAIKFFQRALQVDPGFTYAYTLCGHEYVSSDDLEKSLLCFRNALRLDDTHYNAWYGLGMIYYKQEKFELAEYHFRKAIKLNPISSVLYCYLGMVLLSNNSPQEALEVLNRAIQLDPKNSLAKFKRASALVTLQEYETALSELNTLREFAPKEPPIYFLLGKIYKKLDQPEKAIQHLTIALDLDSKNSNFIKNAIEKLHHPEEEDEQDLELT